MLQLKLNQLPEKIREMPNPPKQLFYEGADLLELLKLPCVAIVGTRAPTTYGRRATQEFARQLAEQGVVIISGLAYGVDAIAHETALEAGGKCIAVLPGPLDNIVPVANQGLAQRIIRQGGTLVTEQKPGTLVFKQLFIARNRLMSGLSNGVLITEASEKSGSLHTANFALEQGREVMIVPGSIYSAPSCGCNNFLKSSQGHLVTNYQDVLEIIGLNNHITHTKEIKGRNRNEQTILDLLLQGVSDGYELLDQSGIEVSKFSQSLTMLEISGKIRPLGANNWAIS